ncbi:LLM class flavin-dependent oxidoreductase [Enterococcus aquimarinus]|uniref:Luciferase n=1 Tax=Enterococcus aquimarinus TaxID=328396 RepID=A0A1L8QUF7_9ENTE|nr:LLM class flavin-dependent oxidoreductase [Enterococcus aquimarinus]OJG11149.1 luciferase [Enterococcus aquimarinus]
MKLSVLDQGIIAKGETAEQALAQTVALAKAVDELEYHRIWYSEHHSSRGLASTAPEIVVAHIASVTKNIRVGTGGVMLMHYAPYKVAEVFNTLATLHPHRIDLGIGRAPGGDYGAMLALSQGKRPELDNIYEKIEETLQYMNQKHPNTQAFAGPIASSLPEAWLLGSSGNSARQAAELGMGYSYAHFIGGQLETTIFEQYRHHFTPSYFMEKPQMNVGYATITADSKEEAEFEAASLDLMFLNIEKGISGPLVSPEEALSRPYSEMDKMRIEANRRRMIVGTTKEVAETLRQNEQKYGIQEAMIVAIHYSRTSRLKTYQSLAKEFGLLS